VCITADAFNYGSAWYFPRSFYAIYTLDGKPFKNGKSQYSAGEESPHVLALPFGFYMVVARSEKDRYIRCPLSSRRASEGFSTWISEKRDH
jgi:hypothetical protein